MTAFSAHDLSVHDAMSTDVVTVPSSATVGSAVDRVFRRGHTHVVVTGDDGALLDIVSAHLLTTALMTRLVGRQQRIADVLAEPATVAADAGLADAAGVMVERSVDAVGVVDPAGVLLGILTWTDIGRCAVMSASDRAERRAPR